MNFWCAYRPLLADSSHFMLLWNSKNLGFSVFLGKFGNLFFSKCDFEQNWSYCGGKGSWTTLGPFFRRKKMSQKVTKLFSKKKYFSFFFSKKKLSKKKLSKKNVVKKKCVFLFFFFKKNFSKKWKFSGKWTLVVKNRVFWRKWKFSVKMKIFSKNKIF